MVDPELLLERGAQLVAHELGGVQRGLTRRGPRAPRAPGVSAPSDHRWRWCTASTRGSASSAASIAVGVHAPRRLLEQHRGGVADQRPGRDEHERGDGERDRGVDPVGAGGGHDHAGDDHPERAERVRREVEERAAQVQVLAAHPGDEPRAAGVDRRARCTPTIATPDAVDGAAGPRTGRSPRQTIQTDATKSSAAFDERGEHLGALPAVGGAGRRRTRAEHQRDEGERRARRRRWRGARSRRAARATRTRPRPRSAPPGAPALSGEREHERPPARRRRRGGRVAGSWW